MATITRTRGDRLLIRQCTRNVTIFPSTEGIEFVDAANLNTHESGNINGVLRGTSLGVVKKGTDVYLLGGQASTGLSAASLDDVRKYDTVNKTVTALTDLPAGRGGGAVGLLGDSIFYIGGVQLVGGIAQARTTVYQYSIENDSWSTLAATTPSEMRYCKSVVFDNKIYALVASTGVRRLVSFDPTSSTFTTIESSLPGNHELNSENPFGNPVVFADKIYFLEGRSTTMLRYDPITGNIDELENLYSLAYEGPAGSLIGGRYYVAAGGHMYPGSGQWSDHEREGVSIIDLVSLTEVSTSLTLKVNNQLHGLQGITVGDTCFLFGGSLNLNLPNSSQNQIQAVATSDPFS